MKRERFFDSAGVTLRFLDAGAGEPVVLLHSYTGSAERDFVRTGLFDALAARHRAIALDLRGHGGSAKPHDARFYGREMAQDVVRLLDRLHVRRAHVVGYSLGAHLVAQLLARSPERLITATLGGAPGRRRWTDDDQRRAVAEAAEIARGAMRAQILRLHPATAPPLSDDEIARRTAACLAGNDCQALAAIRLSNREQVITDEALAASGIPTLGLVGREDRYLAEFRALAASMSRLELVVIEGATHDSACADPAFRDALLAFLDRHRMP